MWPVFNNASENKIILNHSIFKWGKTRPEQECSTTCITMTGTWRPESYCLTSEKLFYSEWPCLVGAVCLQGSGIWLQRSTRAALSWLCQLFEKLEGLEMISVRRAISQCITTLNLEVHFWVCSKQHPGLFVLLCPGFTLTKRRAFQLEGVITREKRLSEKQKA